MCKHYEIMKNILLINICYTVTILLVSCLLHRKVTSHFPINAALVKTVLPHIL